jgi:hypothetical protein
MKKLINSKLLNSRISNSRSDLDINNQFFTKSKRSQTTLFIIIAILVLGFAIIMLFVGKANNNGNNIDISKISPDVLPVYNLVEDCLRITGEDSLVWVGNRGGYVISPEKSLDEVAYYFYDNENLMISKESIEENISLYFDNFLSFCFKDFLDVPDFKVSYGDVKTKTRIENSSVFIDVKLPLTILKSDKRYYLNDFQTEISVRLGTIYNVNSEIMAEQMKKKDAVCFSCLKRISEKNNVTINMFDAANNSILFVVSDDLSKINDKNYEFYFANKYE